MPFQPDIWDLHCHLSGVPGKTPEERLDNILVFADRMGVQKLCVFMGLEWAYDPAPEKFRSDNDQVLRAIAHRPDRVFGFVYLNPKHTQKSLDELKRCVRDGPMVGVKLWVAERCNSPKLDPIIDLAAELQAIVFQHTWIKQTGNLPGESTPMDLAELAARHPEAALICGHAGGDWEQGIRAVRPFQNVYLDLAGGDPVSGITEMAVRETGAARILYGSDIGGRSFASQIAKVTGARISGEHKRMILSGNLKRLLHPILKRKGMIP